MKTVLVPNEASALQQLAGEADIAILGESGETTLYILKKEVAENLADYFNIKPEVRGVAYRLHIVEYDYLVAEELIRQKYFDVSELQD